MTDSATIAAESIAKCRLATSMLRKQFNDNDVRDPEMVVRIRRYVGRILAAYPGTSQAAAHVDATTVNAAVTLTALAKLEAAIDTLALAIEREQAVETADTADEVAADSSGSGEFTPAGDDGEPIEPPLESEVDEVDPTGIEAAAELSDDDLTDSERAGEGSDEFGTGGTGDDPKKGDPKKGDSSDDCELPEIDPDLPTLLERIEATNARIDELSDKYPAVPVAHDDGFTVYDGVSREDFRELSDCHKNLCGYVRELAIATLGRRP